jgi:hypothetical protein
MTDGGEHAVAPAPGAGGREANESIRMTTVMYSF